MHSEKLKSTKIALFSCAAFFMSACHKQESAAPGCFCCDTKERPEVDWADSLASISAESFESGHYDYTITYDVPESTAVTYEGKKIIGPIQQHGISKKKPIVTKKLKLKYMREEPIVFDLIDPIQFED